MKQNLVVLKNDFTSALERIVDSVLEGEESALRLSVIIKAMETALDNAKGKIQDVAMSEAELYGERSFKDHGARFNLTEAGIKYDYSQSTSWSSLQSTIEEARNRQKAIEEQMKKASEHTPYIDAESGEVITGVPKQSKKIIKITLL